MQGQCAVRIRVLDVTRSHIRRIQQVEDTPEFHELVRRGSRQQRKGCIDSPQTVSPLSRKERLEEEEVGPSLAALEV